MKVLITGGAGFIGSTIASCCHDAGITPIILDNYNKGLRVYAHRFDHYDGDVSDRTLLRRLFADHPDIDAVIHCAAHIVVPESTDNPLEYYRNNFSRALILLDEMHQAGIDRFILSSTASLYNPGDDLLCDESSPVDPQSPYSASKWMLERALKDIAATGKTRSIALRYFNPIGADPQLRTGLQNPHPTHVLGKMIEAHAAHDTFTVTGIDWATRDGSGLRDYIHVWDLARAHVCALIKFDEVMTDAVAPGYDIINLGTGTGTTVFELVRAFEDATGIPLNVRTSDPRPGDVIGCASKIDKAVRVLGWKPELSIADGLRHSLAWSQKLPEVLTEEQRLIDQERQA